MKIKEGFVLREISGMNVVMPSGKNVKDFKGAVMLNESGVVLFKRLRDGAELPDLVKALTDVYDIDEATAKTDAEKTLESFREVRILDE